MTPVLAANENGIAFAVNRIPIRVPVTMSASRTTIPMSIESNLSTIPVGIDVEVDVIGAETYQGDYEFTPSSEEQTILISNKYATDDITIHPIPQNYGLITWDGSTLLVS